MRTVIPIFLIALMLLISSCDIAGLIPDCRVPAYPYDEFEPNNTVAQAKELPATLNASLTEAGSKNGPDTKDFIDHFAFTGEAAEVINMKLVLTDGGGLEVTLQMLDPSAQVIDAAKPVGRSENTTTSMIVTLPKSGRYTARISGQYVGPSDSFCSVGQIKYQLITTRTKP
jgi:hypothetical protein